MIIRIAEVSDAESFCAAETKWAETPGHLVSRPSEFKPQMFANKIAYLEKHNSGIYLAAVSENNKVIGHAMLDPIEMKALSHIVRLTIVVHPGKESAGVGSALMNYLIDWAKKHTGIKKIELHVRAVNEPALFLYKKFGFTEEGRFKKRIKAGEDQYIDDLAMGLFV